MLIYKINEESKLIIEDNALNKMLRYCQKHGMDESGGILLGKIREDFSEYIIVDITEPSKMDRSGRYFFIRDKRSAQRILNKQWKASGGEINYFGEWHTHPEIKPIPSPDDRQLVDDCLSTIKNIQDILFLIIQGYDGSLFVGYKTKHMNKLMQLFKEQ